MAYRKSSSPSADVKRVELLRFEPRSRQWIVWAAITAVVASIECVYFLDAERSALTMLLPLVFVIVALVRALRSSCSVVATLERDEQGRAFCVQRSLFGLSWKRRWPSEETPVIFLRETSASSGLASPLAIVATVRVDDRTTVSLFESTSHADATAFRAEAFEFAQKAERLPGERWYLESAELSAHNRTAATRKELERAIERDDVEALRALLESGLALETRLEYEHMTPVEFAASRGAVRCTRALIDLGARVSPDVLALAGYCAPLPDGGDRDRYLQHVEVVRVLLDAGVDPDAQNRHGVPARMPVEDAGPEMAALVEARARKA